VFASQNSNNAAKHSAGSPLGRRRFLKAAGIGGLGVGAASLLGASSASAEDAKTAGDAAILNFALNLKYLEAEYYAMATTGAGLPDELTTGTGTRGAVTGGRAVAFKTPFVKQYAQEIARDELNQVKFLRSTLGAQAVARPAIDLAASFATAATAAGITKNGQTFDPYESEQLFLWGAYVFEDVGVTALRGAIPMLTDKTSMAAAAGMLGTEAFHASLIRSTLYGTGQPEPGDLIAKVRNSLDGVGNDDQGIILNGTANIVPADDNGLVFGRAPERVLNIVYLTPNVASAGGFFPNGLNGTVKQSGGAPGAVPGPQPANPAPGQASAPAPAPNAPAAPPSPGAAPVPAHSPSVGVGVGVTPSGGAATGAGGTAGGRDAGLLIGGAVAAVTTVVGASGYHRNRKLVTDVVPQGDD